MVISFCDIKSAWFSPSNQSDQLSLDLNDLSFSEGRSDRRVDGKRTGTKGLGCQKPVTSGAELTVLVHSTVIVPDCALGAASKGLIVVLKKREIPWLNEG